MPAISSAPASPRSAPGLSRTVLESYLPAFFVAGALCVFAALIILMIARPAKVPSAELLNRHCERAKQSQLEISAKLDCFVASLLASDAEQMRFLATSEPDVTA